MGTTLSSVLRVLEPMFLIRCGYNKSKKKIPFTQLYEAVRDEQIKFPNKYAEAYTAAFHRLHEVAFPGTIFVQWCKP